MIDRKLMSLVREYESGLARICYDTAELYEVATRPIRNHLRALLKNTVLMSFIKRQKKFLIGYQDSIVDKTRFNRPLSLDTDIILFENRTMADVSLVFTNYLGNAVKFNASKLKNPRDSNSQRELYNSMLGLFSPMDEPRSAIYRAERLTPSVLDDLVNRALAHHFKVPYKTSNQSILKPEYRGIKNDVKMV